MKEMELCVIMTKAEWDEAVAKGKLHYKKDKKSFVKGDVVLHEDGKPYLCMKDNINFNTLNFGSLWKAVIVQH